MTTWTIDLYKNGVRTSAGYSKQYSNLRSIKHAATIASEWLKDMQSRGYSFPAGYEFKARLYIHTALDNYGINRGG